MKFKEFLQLEGGNIKIGDVAAQPIKVTPKNRVSHQNDIHTAMEHLHDAFHAATKEHLFGAGREALKTKSTYSGSTKHLMSKDISHEEFAKHKSYVGDVDVQVPHEHLAALGTHLKAGGTYGKYSVIGVKAHGAEASALMKHSDTGHVHQFDFEGVKYKNHEPTKEEQFLHSSSWEDTKAGIKGMHHKILLNAAGGEKHKFSLQHGIRSRTDETDKGTAEPKGITKRLFGVKADHEKIHSFHGVADLIKKHIPKEQHQAVYDKFKASTDQKGKIDHTNALSHLKKTLGVKGEVNESVEEVNHTSVIPLVGFSPISHMGHAKDLGSALAKLPGKKHVGVSKKADLFDPKERHDIMKRQWGDIGAEHHSASSAGEVIAKAHASLPETGKKHLHILVGADRLDMAHKLAASIHAGKIKELEGKKFDKITVHQPEDTERTHGMSGTNMRTAASTGDIDTFHKHLGPMFKKSEALNIMNKVKSGIDSGQLKVKR